MHSRVGLLQRTKNYRLPTYPLVRQRLIVQGDCFYTTFIINVVVCFFLLLLFSYNFSFTVKQKIPPLFLFSCKNSSKNYHRVVVPRLTNPNPVLIRVPAPARFMPIIVGVSLLVLCLLFSDAIVAKKKKKAKIKRKKKING